MPLLGPGTPLDAEQETVRLATGSDPVAATESSIRPEFRQGHPLNLSISISGGEETNQDSPSSGERTGKSPT